MQTISIPMDNFEVFLLVFVRVSALIAIAPFFGIRNTPVTLKIGLSFFLSVILLSFVPSTTVVFNSTIEFGALLIKEALVGIIIGFGAYAAVMIISLAGQLIDQQIGFTMVNVFDPLSRVQLSITGNLYYYLILLIMIVTNMHFFIIKALVETFTLIPLGEAVFKPSLYFSMIDFFTNYFIIAFRISLPIYGAILIVDVILGILARAVPQMNMFVVGLPLKVFVGLFVLVATIGLMPAISDFIFDEMLDIMARFIKGMSE